jgi:ATP-dependent DNA helicase DinG
MNNTIFSVVDIETTGSNQSEDKNRIIQFSCTFVQNQEIIGSFNSFINPMIEIPNDITKLTGISNETVAQAPTFAEIADKIYQLLQNTVFVAHNVNFDFSFLNLEFKRNQHEILKNKAIDTVTLSQLLFPTESSYKLTDLSKRFNIIHQHPHSSSSDALATAKILILILKRINNLPQYIIKQILQVNPTLPKDSLMVFKTAVSLTSSNQKNPDLILNNHLLIRKVKYQQTPQMVSLKYSTNRTQKQKKFLGLKNINVNENRLMNLVYQNYSKQGGRNLVIEENNYFDADLSYLLPLYYRASIDRPIIIAVAGKEQQTHIQQILTLINHNMNSPKKALILDDVQNYIDLTKFADSLKIISSSKYTQFLKCKILIWLTMTKTGNLNELKLRSNNSQNEFINIISSAHNDGFYIKKLNYDINNTAIIITSHTYLLQNAIQLSTKKPYLVIKNAKQLPLAALKDKRVKLFLNNNHIITNHIIGMLHQTHNKNIYEIFQNSTSPRFMVKKLENVIIQISEYINEFNQALQNSLYNKQQLVEDDKGYHMRISNHALKQVIHKYDKLFNLIARKQQIVLDINHALKQHLHHFSSAQKAILYTFFDKIDEYNLFLNQQIFKLRLLCQGKTENRVFIWQINADKDIKNAVLTGGMIFNKQLLQEQVYQYFTNFIIMDHAIYSSKRSQFFYETLELKRKKTRMIKLLPSTAQKKHSNNNFQFITTPADTDISIVEVMKHNIRGNTFIWTASQKRALELEAQLKNSAIDDTSVILSQDVNNNNKKIVKKMNNSRQNIMIGNQKLLQAIQQRKKSIQILIIDSLAITNFDNLYLQANYELKQKQLGNARARFSIPLAILEIRQAIENIILLSNQNGIIYMQDQTLISDTYRQNIAELLSLKLITMSKEQLIAAFDRLDNEKRGD